MIGWTSPWNSPWALIIVICHEPHTPEEGSVSQVEYELANNVRITKYSYKVHPQGVLANFRVHQICVLHRWSQHLSLHILSWEILKGQLLPAHQGQQWSHQEEEPTQNGHVLVQPNTRCSWYNPGSIFTLNNCNYLEWLEETHTDLHSSSLTIRYAVHPPR